MTRYSRGLPVTDDAKLVERCLAGDEAGLRVFVERFQGPVFGLCLRMLGRREDAEDVSQEVFLRTFRSLHTWDSARPLKPWLLTIAANRCRTALERRSRQPSPTEYVETIADGSPEPANRDLAEELERALGELREDYRTCFELFYREELSVTEISSTLDCPEGTVKTWLYRARRELAELLRRRGVVPYAQYELQES
ncbi:MAG: RNA polymerase sigma factor [Planctomycetes bacterium]|nr:RNA polymerase sigma factor [Planctomycetota bacterium]